ncbi:glycoside hydrolase [Thozetella sp. PMI_491]|nr:glycoside hydrolase [Thozetella sp. PMI_491]
MATVDVPRPRLYLLGEQALRGGMLWSIWHLRYGPSCNAKSECDPAGWGPHKFGFCGTTPEFCGDLVIKSPSCSGKSAEQRTIGYYESWSITRDCDGMMPETIPWGSYTHINFAFASIDPRSFEVVPSDLRDLELYARLTAMKRLAPGLQVWISIGGWAMNDPDQPTATTFSDLAASPQAQASFADSLIRLMSAYGFDGVDIDWEYPVAPERSGRPEDYANFPTWLANLRGAFAATGRNYGLSITLPSSFWYLQNFDISISLAMMGANTKELYTEYDLHGTWDLTDKWLGPKVNAHTNLTEIDASLKLLWRNNIDPSKVVLGLGFYGRSFALQDPSCTAPGCFFTGGAPNGRCTNDVGTLSYAEIGRLIAAGATVTFDQAAAVKIVTWDGNWVSYDDASTLRMKIQYANSNCLGGTMVWAVSLDDQDGTASKALGAANGIPRAETLIAINNNPVSVCGWSTCTPAGRQPECPLGQSAAFSTTDGCGVTNDQIRQAGSDGLLSHRHYCCPINQMPTCKALQPPPGSCTVPDRCPTGTTSILRSQRFDTSPLCLNINVNWCCTTPPPVISARSLGCFWTSCGQPFCPADTAVLGSATLGQDGAPTCIGVQTKNLCCPAPLAIDLGTCSWEHGRSLLGLCVSGCPKGKIPIADDIDRQPSCILGFSTYCCDPPRDLSHAAQEGESDFVAVSRAFMTGGTCNAGGSSLAKRQSGSELGVVSTMYMAQRLAPLIWDYLHSEFESTLIEAYAQDWESVRRQTGNIAPSWGEMVDTVAPLSINADITEAIAKKLCTKLVIVTTGSDVCSLETCGGATCPAQKRAMTETPADVTGRDYDTSNLRQGPAMTQPNNNFPGGVIEWWRQAKNLAWWRGSNHGFSRATLGGIPSSAFVDFALTLGENVVTGAGPVWGCTTVAVVSERGAWTAHIWEGPYFTNGDAILFANEVLEFLQNGNAAEGYPGLANLVAPGGAFHGTTHLQVHILTPQQYTIIPGTVTAAPHYIPNVGQRYPLEVSLIQSTLQSILGVAANPIVHTYLVDGQIRVWRQIATTTSAGSTFHWAMTLDRTPRLTIAPWTGMFTVQRSPTVAGQQTTVRIYSENNQVSQFQF